MTINKSYCMSSFLMFRMIARDNMSFSKECLPRLSDLAFKRTPVRNPADLKDALKEAVRNATQDGKAALALSGGIDSAILARLMPAGSTAYTFKCVVPGVDVIDETDKARKYADACGLVHKVVEIYWEDVKELAGQLMIHKGAPIHSIEIQIYKAALQAKADGFDKLIFGENADIIYGGMDGLISKNWLYGEFVDRYTYVMPYYVLKEPEIILEPYIEFCNNGHIDGHNFINKYFRREALGTYTNACETAGVEFVGPYSQTVMDVPIDYHRIRSGETKYFVREVYRDLYPAWKEAQKIPMPRPMNEWMKDWRGPIRDEFIPHCTDNMTGDQKWMVYALEQFLDGLER